MRATGTADERTTPDGGDAVRAARASLHETAWRHQLDEVSPEDLPMAAARALAAGLDTPALCELAGWPRNHDSGEIRQAFEKALREAGIDLPDLPLARRHALRRLAARVVGEDVTPAELARDDWWETEAETAEERAFVALMPPCTCCLEYTIWSDRPRWTADLRRAARALASAPPIGPVR